MATQQEVMIKQGPDDRGNHVGSTVVGTPEKCFWVSTVDLRREPSDYETLVFSIPPEVELTRDTNRKPVFSQDFPYNEVPIERAGLRISYNTTNMPSEADALKNHKDTVQAIARALI